MKVETVTCSYDLYGGGRYGVFLRLDGALTSWDCSHLHHSPKAAEKCHRALSEHAGPFLADATVTAIGTAMVPDLYEARRDTSNEPGFGTWTMKRFTWPCVDVTPIEGTER
jgi:hypothetical protein